ncbi:MAG: ribosome assembly RNA-binding protein YhbY [Gammaproteobacteria bacterium]|nr:ribosome assembly RNA-binding protein YhbY [Gammaproteobacteria bacterium]
MLSSDGGKIASAKIQQVSLVIYEQDIVEKILADSSACGNLCVTITRGGLSVTLSTKFKQQLKAKAHKLKPIVLVGNNGLSPTVNMEIDRALHDHQLIKMRINAEDRVLRKELFAEICKEHHADLVQMVGKVGVIYREKPEE